MICKMIFVSINSQYKWFIHLQPTVFLCYPKWICFTVTATGVICYSPTKPPFNQKPYKPISLTMTTDMNCVITCSHTVAILSLILLPHCLCICLLQSVSLLQAVSIPGEKDTDALSLQLLCSCLTAGAAIAVAMSHCLCLAPRVEKDEHGDIWWLFYPLS